MRALLSNKSLSNKKMAENKVMTNQNNFNVVSKFNLPNLKNSGGNDQTTIIRLLNF